MIVVTFEWSFSCIIAVVIILNSYTLINLFTESSSNKIFLPLLQKFANGVNASEISGGNAIDDITDRGDSVPAFLDYIVGPGSVIFATMALAIKNIVKNSRTLSSVTILNFAESNLLNVSDYMRDLMVAYLPIFNKHLNIIIAKANLLHRLVETTDIVYTHHSNDDVAESRFKKVKSDNVADV